jgi:XTP/dITP diphosphohydrolase
VLLDRAGEHGFGYDPIFRPAGLTVSSAQLTADEKNSMSHRALAFGQLIEVIRAR